jgi:GxxExxY protein
MIAADVAEERNRMQVNEVSRHVVDAAMKVHSALGPGLLESAYEAILCFELRRRGLHVENQVAVPIVYHGHRIEVGYRIDILVEASVIVEIKTVSTLLPIHEAQLLSYLRLSGTKLGLLLNFNVVHMRDGIKRMVHAL